MYISVYYNNYQRTGSVCGHELLSIVAVHAVTPDHENNTCENFHYYSTATIQYCIGHACTGSAELKYVNNVVNTLQSRECKKN